MTFLSGIIAIVGPPNVGKSTLLNRILGSKIAIVTPKPQTTRNRILGIYHGKGFQMVFMDTPGIHKSITPLHKSMVFSAQSAFKEVDSIIFMVDAHRSNDPNIEVILKDLAKAKKPSLLVINKIDKVSKERLLPMIDAYRQLHPFRAIVPISALKGDGVIPLLRELKSMLKSGPALFPEDMDTDQSSSFLVSEMIREKIYLYSRQELPYSSAVSVQTMVEVPEKDLISIAAKIHVESESQKGILIGRQGKMIKTIGQSSRQEIEGLLGKHVFLDLQVRVEKNWTKNPKALRRLGY